MSDIINNRKYPEIKLMGGRDATKNSRRKLLW